MAELETLEIETGHAPRASILMLHGLGADGNDFAPLASELDLSPVGPVRLVLPHAPVVPVTINGGYRMRAWYDILGTEMQGRQDEAGLRRAHGWVEALLQREQERGIDSRRIVLAGFSQGSAMALLAGLRHSRPLAGIAGLSGYLPLAETTARERHPSNASTPLFLAHGRHDDIVVPARGESSRDALRGLGWPVEWHDYPMGHSVCPQELQDLQAWLLRVLAHEPLPENTDQETHR
jgi:phospholipase/carboxylesterase